MKSPTGVLLSDRDGGCVSIGNAWWQPSCACSVCVRPYRDRRATHGDYHKDAEVRLLLAVRFDVSTEISLALSGVADANGAAITPLAGI